MHLALDPPRFEDLLPEVFAQVVGLPHGVELGHDDMDIHVGVPATAEGAHLVDGDDVPGAHAVHGRQHHAEHLGILRVQQGLGGFLHQPEARAGQQQADDHRHDGIEPFQAGELHSQQPDRDAHGGPEVGEDMVAIGLQGPRALLAALGEEEPAQQPVEDAGQQVDGQALSEILQFNAVDETLGCLEHDEHGGQGDEATLEGGAEMLDLPVAVRVFLVRGFAREDDGAQGEHRRHHVHHAFDGIGFEGHRTRQLVGQVLQAEDADPRHDG